MKKKTIITILFAFALIMSNLSVVFADDGDVQPTETATQETEEMAVEETEEVALDEAGSETPAPMEEEQDPEQGSDESAETTQAVGQEELDSAAEDDDAEPEADAQSEIEEVDVSGISAESEQEDLGELVQVLNEGNVEVVSDEGESLPLASEEAAAILASTDPFFWNGAQWVGFTQDGTGCPANVVCNASATPFQEAVTQAGAGNTVYVASGNYAEDVIINNADQSLVAFQDVTVPDASLPTITIDSSGFAVVQSITLNVDLTLNDGVYADFVTVNQPGQTGGRLDDAMDLVNDGGRIEADVQIYSADGHYRVRDVNHHDVNFEWECGEPNEVIYPGRTYRMTLMNPLDQTIVDYYEAHGDERNTAPWNLDLTALERIEDLRIAVNVSEDVGNWSHSNEERIYWYLVGNTGSSSTSSNINLNSTQQNWADQITNGDYDDVTRYWDIWFMYPNQENGNSNISAANRQLTFLVYDPRPVFGCLDPLALNFDINADTDDESCVYYEGCTDPAALNYNSDALVDDGTCRYESTTETPPQFIPDPLPIPVTGEEEFLIPVTGKSAESSSENQIELLVSAGSLILMAAVAVYFTKKREISI